MNVLQLWEKDKTHVESMLSQAQSHVQILKFVELMCDHYRAIGCSEAQIDDLRTLVGMRGLHHSMKIKNQQDKLEDSKKDIFEPGREACVVVSIKQVDRLVDLITERNNKLKPEEERIRKKTNPKYGRITYRVVQ